MSPQKAREWVERNRGKRHGGKPPNRLKWNETLSAFDELCRKVRFSSGRPQTPDVPSRETKSRKLERVSMEIEIEPEEKPLPPTRRFPKEIEARRIAAERRSELRVEAARRRMESHPAISVPFETEAERAERRLRAVTFDPDQVL